MPKIRVMIIDDSASMRQTLTDILLSDPEIAVIAVAADPYVAAKRLQDEVPDVITLDVEMPRMDGLTFLRKLMAQHPVPVVMCSSLVEDGSQTLLQALEAGAVDVILKPKLDTRRRLLEARVTICDAVKAAAQCGPSLTRRKPAPSRRPAEKLTADAVLPPPSCRPMAQTTEKIICVGASTGGTESLRVLLETLPIDCPGVVIVQHMPEKFTAAFAKRLDGLCDVAVKEAADGDPILRGHVLIAPGNRHTLVRRSGARYYVEVKDGPLVSRHRPSVDVLFRSAAHGAGPNAVGVIMTGMGDDGARGLLEMRSAGAFTIAEDESSCVVFGMPREAIELGAAALVAPLERLAVEMLRAAE